MNTSQSATDVQTITSNFPIPGFDCVPINVFVIKGAEPILVDTGTVVESAKFMSALRSGIDPAALLLCPEHTGFIGRALGAKRLPASAPTGTMPSQPRRTGACRC